MKKVIFLLSILISINVHASTWQTLKEADQYGRLKGNGMDMVWEGLQLKEKYPKISEVNHIPEFIKHVEDLQSNVNKVKGFLSKEETEIYSKIEKNINQKINNENLNFEDVALFYLNAGNIICGNKIDNNTGDFGGKDADIFLPVFACKKDVLLDFVPLTCGFLFGSGPVTFPKLEEKEMNPKNITYNVHGAKWNISNFFLHDFLFHCASALQFNQKQKDVLVVFQKAFLQSLKMKEENKFLNIVALLSIASHERGHFIKGRSSEKYSEKQLFDLALKDLKTAIVVPNFFNKPKLYFQRHDFVVSILNEFLGYKLKANMKTEPLKALKEVKNFFDETIEEVATYDLGFEN